MSKHHLEQRLKRHFDTAPEPDQEILERTIASVVREAASARTDSDGMTFVPKLRNLIVAQVQLTRGVVWLVQAAVVIFALVVAASAQSPAFMLASFGAATVIMVAISVAGITSKKDAGLAELSYSCHFDYRQIMLVRMVIYGTSDIIAFSLLTVVGSTLLPLSFGSVLMCTSSSFFLTACAMMIILTRYRGETVLILCAVISSLIACVVGYVWFIHSGSLQNLSSVFWLALVVCSCGGVIYCARSILSRINTGFESIRNKSH